MKPLFLHLCLRAAMTNLQVTPPLPREISQPKPIIQRRGEKDWVDHPYILSNATTSTSNGDEVIESSDSVTNLPVRSPAKTTLEA